MDRGATPPHNAKVLRTLQITRLKDTVHDMSEVVGNYFAVVQKHYLARQLEVDSKKEKNASDNSANTNANNTSGENARLETSFSMRSLHDLITNYYVPNEAYNAFFFFKPIRQIVADQGHVLLTSYAGANKGPLIHKTIFHIKKENIMSSKGHKSVYLNSNLSSSSSAGRRNNKLYVRQMVGVVSPETLTVLMDKYAFGKRRKSVTKESESEVISVGLKMEVEGCPLNCEVKFSTRPVLALLKDYTDTAGNEHTGKDTQEHSRGKENLQNFKLFNSYERIIFENEMILLQNYKTVFTKLLAAVRGEDLDIKEEDSTVVLPLYFVYIAAHDSAATRLKVVTNLTNFCIDFVTNSNFSSGVNVGNNINRSQRVLYYNTVILQIFIDVVSILSSGDKYGGGLSSRSNDSPVTDELFESRGWTEKLLRTLLSLVDGALAEFSEESSVVLKDTNADYFTMFKETIYATFYRRNETAEEEVRSARSNKSNPGYTTWPHDEGKEEMNPSLLRPPSTIVHCLQGVSRSASVVLIYFMQTYSKFLSTVRQFEIQNNVSIQTDKSQLVSYAGLLEAVQALRPVVRPNVCFAVEMLALWKRWIEEGGEVA